MSNLGKRPLSPAQRRPAESTDGEGDDDGSIAQELFMREMAERRSKYLHDKAGGSTSKAKGKATIATPPTKKLRKVPIVPVESSDEEERQVKRRMDVRAYVKARR